MDHDGNGEVQYPEFLEIMTVMLQRLAEEEGSEKNEGQVGRAADGRKRGGGWEEGE